MTPLFCPQCRMRIMPPSFLLKANIKAENGITLQCENKNSKGVQCRGKVKIKLEQKELSGS